MNHVSLSEFLHLTGLADKDLLSMLENGELQVATGPMGELLIDISEVTPDYIASRARGKEGTISPSRIALLEEMVASEVIREVDGLVDEALELSLRWVRENRSSDLNK